MLHDVADFATSSKGYVAIIARDSGSADSYVPRMLDKWLTELLKDRDVSQAALARRLTDKLGKAVDRSIVNKMCSGARDISAYELAAILEIFDEMNPLSGRDLPPKALAAAKLFARLDPERQDRILGTIEDLVLSEERRTQPPGLPGSDGRKGR
jgi:hypothetical protein